MFQNIYKSAYDKMVFPDTVKINESQTEAWIQNYVKVAKRENMRKNIRVKAAGRILRPMTVALIMVCLIITFGTSAAAKTVPGFYKVLERTAPGLADYLIPIQENDESNGITMNLEAVLVEESTAKVLVSFCDSGKQNYIHGKTDMYDSYGLYSYDAKSSIGGCSFLEYDESEDKAYFQVDLTSSEGGFDTDRMTFRVGTLLTDYSDYTEEISLENMIENCRVKRVALSGRSGADTADPALDKLSVPGNETDPRPGHSVMDIALENFSPETMEITGIAYMDGILRVQLFRGNFEEADRHMNIYMLDKEGKRISPDGSVTWHDSAVGEEVLMDEIYFVITPEQLAEYTLWGEAESRDGAVKGNWSITFDVP